MYIWMDVRYMFVVMECKKSIKKVSYGHFAECSTRQGHPLPSAMGTALGKAGKPKPFLATFQALLSAAEALSK
jgi:hypothetical protein